MNRIKAICWDVYGTLLAAQRGDLDSLVRREIELHAAFTQAIREFRLPKDAGTLCREFLDAIATRRAAGGTNSEVRVEDIWQEIAPTAPPHEIALYFEQQTNPKQPMPGAKETLLSLKQRGLRQGILSNAQFYTRIELNEFFGEDIFDPALVFLSCDLGIAKPDPTGFQLLTAALARTGITPGECLFVGDSLVNDIAPARQAGFQAVLFGPTGDIQQLPQLLVRL